MSQEKIYLIGGAPSSGKTTFGRLLALRTHSHCISLDDLLSATRALSTPESHPDLHVMSRVPDLQYYTDS